MVNEENLMMLDGCVRNIKCSGRELRFDHGSYIPSFERGDIVQCEFVGIGQELNYRHYALVWSAKADSENINVIPLTSKSKNESLCQFSIGKIHGFYTKDEENGFVLKESFVYLDKMMQVSRKRIFVQYERDADGNTVYENSNGKNRKKKLCVNTQVIERIKERIKLFYLEEGECLYTIINNNISAQYQIDPSSLTSKILSMGYRLVQAKAIYEIGDCIFLICIIENERYSIKFRMIGNVQKSRYNSEKDKKLYKTIKWKKNILSTRKEVIKGLFCGNKETVEEVKKILEKFWENS